MMPSHSWLTRTAATVLTLVTTVTSIAPLRGYSAEFPTATTDPTEQILIAREGKLRTYFEGCNNYISTELDAKGLRRDAGDRPTPIQMMGIGIENAQSADVKFDDIKKDVQVESQSRNLLTALYLQAMANTVTAYIRTLAQYQGLHPGAEEIVKKACSQGAGCPAKGYEFLLRVAQNAVNDAYKLPSYTNADAAAAINTEFRHVNDVLSRVKIRLAPGILAKPIDPTPAEMAAYSQAYMEAATKDGPSRLLALPIINDKIGRIQTPSDNLGYKAVFMEYTIPSQPGVRIPALWENGYGTTVRDHIYQLGPNDRYAFYQPHRYVTTEEVAKAIPEGVSLVEGQMADLNNAVSLSSTQNYKGVQAGVTSVIGTNALAAHVVLLQYTELAPSACRAFRDFAFEHARAHKTARYKANAFRAAAFVMVAASFVVPACAYFGALSLSEAALALSVPGLLMSAAYEIDSIKEKPKAERKLDVNIASVLSENESPEVIVTRIPEEIAARTSARRDVYVNGAFLALSVFYVAQDIVLGVKAVEGLKTLDPITKTALAEKEGLASFKMGFQGYRVWPLIAKGMTYLGYQDYQGTVIKFEEDEGSGIFLRARVDAFDDRRGYVKLTVISRTGPNGPMKIAPPVIQMPIDSFRSIIQGFKS